VPHVRVAVPVPALEALTYAVPPESAPPALGARVLVPLGTRVVTGIVVGTEQDDAANPPAARSVSSAPGPPKRGPHECKNSTDGDHAAAHVKDLLDVLDDEPFLPGEIVTLTSWVAEYYACGIGEAIAAAMPPRAWIESERYVQITPAGLAGLPTAARARGRVLEQLASGKPVRAHVLARQGRHVHATLQALAADGLVTITRPLVGQQAAFRTVRVAHLTAQGHGVQGAVPRPAVAHAAVAPDSGADAVAVDTLALGARQRLALELLSGAPDGLDTAALAHKGVSAATLKRLAALGLLTITTRRVERDPFGHAAAPVPDMAAPLELTGEQTHALERLGALTGAGRFAVAVLHGVTGSGKTEIYLRLADEVVRAGRGVLVLVPEIALTPAVSGAFGARFSGRVAIQHSGLSDGERYDQWHRVRRGEVDVVIGTRSAVFAPLPRLGLVIVDEEHDSAYKQEESPRYHGRDVAVVRAREAEALVVLGSATPSMESYHNAQNGRYALIRLERRVLDRPLATVRLVDMREEYAAAGPDVIISGELAEAIRTRHERGEQSVVLLNRRGFATSVFCRQCGAVLECPNCSVTLTVHRAARRARCHYCNYSIGVPKACAACAGTYLEQTGFGTERVEAEVAALVPGLRVARVDRDTVRRRGAIMTLLERFRAGQLDVLVGTQMIAKGHDFPRVTLVGVISADVGLGLADFRAAERTFHLLTQVAGRAGRGAVAGEAVVQTIHPQHYSIRHACRQDYAGFYQDELTFRRSMQYPPAVALINAVVAAATLDAALADARELVSALRWGGEPYRVLGPAPAPLSRLKGEHRAQFFVKGTHRAAMRKALRAVLQARPEIRRRTTVDVDPMSVL
jgi:primosomal protein N' (replication factor Y) (superfamily II helicase)